MLTKTIYYINRLTGIYLPYILDPVAIVASLSHPQSLIITTAQTHSVLLNSNETFRLKENTEEDLKKTKTLF